LIIGIASGKSGAPAAQYSTGGETANKRNRENTSEPAILKCVLLSNFIHCRTYMRISSPFLKTILVDGVVVDRKGAVAIAGNI
jgi:hypothetical protein